VHFLHSSQPFVVQVVVRCLGIRANKADIYPPQPLSDHSATAASPSRQGSAAQQQAAQSGNPIDVVALVKLSGAIATRCSRTSPVGAITTTNTTLDAGCSPTYLHRDLRIHATPPHGPGQAAAHFTSLPTRPKHKRQPAGFHPGRPHIAVADQPQLHHPESLVRTRFAVSSSR